MSTDGSVMTTGDRVMVTDDSKDWAVFGILTYINDDIAIVDDESGTKPVFSRRKFRIEKTAK